MSSLLEVQRGLYKQKYLRYAQEAAHQAPHHYTTWPSSAAKNPWDTIILEGHYDPKIIFLLDHRLFHNHSGYVVLQAFITTDHHALLINRGWVPKNVHHDQQSLIYTPSGPQQITGTLSIPSNKDWVINQQFFGSDGWPKILQAARMDLIQSRGWLPYPVESAVLTLRCDDSSSFFCDTPSLKESKAMMHYNYAIQFGFFALLCLVATIKTQPWSRANLGENR